MLLYHIEMYVTYNPIKSAIVILAVSCIISIGLILLGN